MSEEITQRYEQVCGQILNTSRNELYLAMRFFDLALSSFGYQISLKTDFIGTDGYSLYYNPFFLTEQFQKSRIWINRAYLHSMLHCLFRHLTKTPKTDLTLWHLSCDIAIESVIDSMYHRCIQMASSALKKEIYRQLNQQLKVLTAEGIYRALLRMSLSQTALQRLVTEFTVDDHTLWPSPKENQPQIESLEQKWKDISEKTQTNMETFSRDAASQSGELLEQVKVENRQKYDYREFLRKFAVLGEEVQLDPDTFDYTFYTYGLELYGNMPLIEPQEVKEVKKVEDFVIAIDTSMSCSGELVQAFLKETYSILKSNDSFFKKVNIHIIQCDEQIQSDQLIENERQLVEYMHHFQLIGNGGTDFRPVFTYVDQLLSEGKFHHLRGLLYFTDGCGIFPTKAPRYQTAFLFMEQEGNQFDLPPWAIQLVLQPEDLEEQNEH